MTRLQAAIGGLIVAPVVIISIAFGAPEILSLPPSATAPTAAVAEVKTEPAPAAPEESAVDRTSVKPTIYKKFAGAAPVTVAAVLPEAPSPAAVASTPQATAPARCERYLYPVPIPKQDGLIDRLFDNRMEQALAEQDKRRRLALNCMRAERGTEGR